MMERKFLHTLKLQQCGMSPVDEKATFGYDIMFKGYMYSSMQVSSNKTENPR